MNNLVNLLASSTGDLEGSLSEVSELIVDIFGILVPILGVIIAALGIFKLVTLGIKLSQNSDDPEARSRIIKAMAWWGVGVFICLAACVAVPAVLFSMFGFNS